ncbi:hypothetical protein ACH5A2_38750 [Streptomyces collinus]|uniref:hypothetical protein n=1 Tax=Streptomyces collinus TaxID=42684 RepID=UPI0037902D38
MTVGRPPWWMQPGSVEVRAVAAGGWWDAVRVPLDLGIDVLRHLGDETGAVIRDGGFGGRLYWLVPPGSAADWNLPQVRVLGRGSHVVIPPLHRVLSPGLCWQIPPSRDREWTNTHRLHSALRTALQAYGSGGGEQDAVLLGVLGTARHPAAPRPATSPAATGPSEPMPPPG